MKANGSVSNTVTSKAALQDTGYQRDYNRRKMPVLAIELDGKEHIEDEIVRERDRKKNTICRDHGFELICVENSYARRYNFIKSVLIDYFGKRRR